MESELIKVIEYLGLCRRKEMIRGLMRIDPNGEYNGISRTIAALDLLRIVVENELKLEDIKSKIR